MTNKNNKNFLSNSIIKVTFLIFSIMTVLFLCSFGGGEKKNNKRLIEVNIKHTSTSGEVVDKLWINSDSIAPNSVVDGNQSSTTVTTSQTSVATVATTKTDTITDYSSLSQDKKNKFTLWTKIARMYLSVYHLADQSRAHLTTQYYSKQKNDPVDQRKLLKIDDTNIKKYLGNSVDTILATQDNTNSSSSSSSHQESTGKITADDLLFAYAKMNVLNQGDGWSSFPKAYYLLPKKLVLDLSTFGCVLNFGTTSSSSSSSGSNNAAVTIKLKDGLTCSCACETSNKDCTTVCSTEIQTCGSTTCQKKNNNCDEGCVYFQTKHHSSTTCSKDKEKGADVIVSSPDSVQMYYSFYDSQNKEVGSIDEVKKVFKDSSQKNVWPKGLSEKLSKKMFYHNSNKLSFMIQTKANNASNTGTTKVVGNNECKELDLNSQFSMALKGFEFSDSSSYFLDKIINKYKNNKYDALHYTIGNDYLLSIPNDKKLKDVFGPSKENTTEKANTSSTSCLDDWTVSDFLFSLYCDFKTSNISKNTAYCCGTFIRTADNDEDKNYCCCCEDNEKKCKEKTKTCCKEKDTATCCCIKTCCKKN